MPATRAIILAGGRGTRLRPYTTTIPKPLMPVGDRPILDVVLRQLRHFGFGRVTIVTGHLAELIEAYTGDGSRYGLQVDYYREDEALGTVGALALLGGLDEPFLVLNGDVLTDLDYRALVDGHRASDAVATIATSTQDVQIPLGVMHFEDEGDDTRVTNYLEKPKLHYQASMGVYCFDPAILEHIEPGVRLDFPDLVLRLVAAGSLVQASRSEAFWLDIGRVDDYEQAQRDFERLYERLLPGGAPAAAAAPADDSAT
ncbi:MAG: nucleoside-diphosphate-sugar pyrophosphorylase [Solirubrobacterales bacterium]|nr:nucleoside-diphosphate-sugar pyrophosphorylase [Solirubrobacterales bacterium]